MFYPITSNYTNIINAKFVFVFLNIYFQVQTAMYERFLKDTLTAERVLIKFGSKMPSNKYYKRTV